MDCHVLYDDHVVANFAAKEGCQSAAITNPERQPRESITVIPGAMTTEGFKKFGGRTPQTSEGHRIEVLGFSFSA
ncbi:hypothetical protein A2875_03755 [Candidatus Gottesmanbacteria bacterium RIFCSPHIGHO2_01_FULL_46_14]|nr:MAG: hypothetical protein A2875_03755 [Candidatus Gottesmanbacteria bacterium RIFCSPHIGHO2_01_FULL_46_14]